jgi:hypothetical protein
VRYRLATLRDIDASRAISNRTSTPAVTKVGLALRHADASTRRAVDDR